MAAQVTRRKPRVGIIGGSGPEAGADLFLKLQAAHRAKLGAAYATDRDALDVLLWSASGVGGPRDVGDVAPGSEGFRRTLKALCVTLKELAPLVDVVVVACNTLHVFEAEMLGFLDLIDQPRSKLVSIMRTIEVEPAACVIRAGEPSNAMFVVVRGKCRVENAKTRSVVEAETGDSFGEQGMLGLRKFSHVTVTTTEPTDLIVFPEDKFMHEFSEMPEVLEELRDTARHLQTLSTGRGSRRSSEKVEAKLISSPSVASSISDAA